MIRQARGVDLTASARAAALGGHQIFAANDREDEGLIEVESRDAFTEFEVGDVSDKIERTYRVRLGPAGSKALFRVDRGAAVKVTAATLLSGVTASPHTGLQTTGTAAPRWRVRWVTRPPPRPIPPHIQIGAGGDLAAIAAGDTQGIGWPPGYARKASFLLSEPAALLVSDPSGAQIGAVTLDGETTIELTPWDRISLQNLGGAPLSGRILWMLMAGGAG